MTVNLHASGPNSEMERKFQKAVNEVARWATVWGFKLSVEKSQTVILTRKKINVDICLKLQYIISI